MTQRSAILSLAVHGVIAALILCIIVAAPPVQGRMLMLPLTSAAAGDIARIALRANLRVISRGAVDGSLVVYGKRAALLTTAWRHDIVLTAAFGGGCERAR